MKNEHAGSTPLSIHLPGCIRVSQLAGWHLGNQSASLDFKSNHPFKCQVKKKKWTRRRSKTNIFEILAFIVIRMSAILFNKWLGDFNQWETECSWFILFYYRNLFIHWYKKCKINYINYTIIYIIHLKKKNFVHDRNPSWCLAPVSSIFLWTFVYFLYFLQKTVVYLSLTHLILLCIYLFI